MKAEEYVLPVVLMKSGSKVREVALCTLPSKTMGQSIMGGGNEMEWNVHYEMGE